MHIKPNPSERLTFHIGVKGHSAAIWRALSGRSRPAPRPPVTPRRFPPHASMHHDAEADCIPIWAAERDPRITRIGRFVPCTRTDELPRLINVLRGDMSIVLVRQTGAVGAIRDRAPFGTSRASVGGEPGCGPYLIVHSPDLVASTPQFWQRDCRSRFTDLTAADPRWRRGARRRARGPIARLTRP